MRALLTDAAAMDVEEIVENFAFLGTWEERYRYLIELGRQLEPMPQADHDELHKVRGCMSQVWLTHRVVPGPPLTLEFIGDSDAHIVKGLIGLLFALLSGKTPQYIVDLDIENVFDRLGLEAHISMNRRNGFYAMVERIKLIARQQLHCA